MEEQGGESRCSEKKKRKKKKKRCSESHPPKIRRVHRECQGAGKEQEAGESLSRNQGELKRLIIRKDLISLTFRRRFSGNGSPQSYTVEYHIARDKSKLLIETTT